MASNYPLHAAAFRNDIEKVRSLLESYPKATITDGLGNAMKHPMNLKDHRGNTALHIAILQKHDDIVRLLLEYNANTRIRNAGHWTPLQEVVATTNRPLLRDMYKHFQEVMREKVKERVPVLMNSLQKSKDFYGEIYWRFSSWLPLVSRFCPSDTFRIWKSGTDVRVDVSLVDFHRFSWKRGHISFIFKAINDPKQPNKVYIVNREKKTIKTVTKDVVRTKHSEADDCEMLLQHEIVRSLFDSDALDFGARKSWFGYEKEEVIENWNCRIYDVKNIQFEMLKRTDHFTPELMERRKRQKEHGEEKWKEAKEWAESHPEDEFDDEDGDESEDGDSEYEELSDAEERSRLSSVAIDDDEDDEEDKIEPYDFPEYVPPEVSFDDYFGGHIDDGVHLGRTPKVETSTKNFKASVWLSKEFPFEIDEIVPILEIIAPSNPHAAKLKQFIELKMPPGFPVQVEIPLFHVLNATATFQNFEHRPISPKIFQLPKKHKHVKFRSKMKKRLKESQQKADADVAAATAATEGDSDLSSASASFSTSSQSVSVGVQQSSSKNKSRQKLQATSSTSSLDHAPSSSASSSDNEDADSSQQRLASSTSLDSASTQKKKKRLSKKSFSKLGKKISSGGKVLGDKIRKRTASNAKPSDAPSEPDTGSTPEVR